MAQKAPATPTRTGLASLPETEQVAALLGDLMRFPQPGTPTATDTLDEPAVVTSSFRVRTRPATGSSSRTSESSETRPKVLGGRTLAEVLASINWHDHGGFDSPLVEPDDATLSTQADGNPAGRPLGGLTLSVFLAGVNWHNDPDKTPLVSGAPGGAGAAHTAPMTIEVFGGMAWE